MSSKRFRVAFSFAGEKREFVSKVARILADRFGKDAILFDEFHKAELSDANAGFDLPKLYHDRTDLIVAVFCPDYPKKEWCGLEWRAIGFPFSMLPGPLSPLHFHSFWRERTSVSKRFTTH